MSDELSQELMDQIVFGMENQQESFCFDTVEQALVPKEEIDEEADGTRFVSLPEWNSVMGFQLMERFVVSLRNPLYRDVLRESLASGRGVFRRFKNALKDRPDIERLWFRFKEREMRKLVTDWFNDYREAIGLDRIAFDEEETMELVLSDFSIYRPDSLDEELSELLRAFDRAAFGESYPDEPPSLVDLFHSRARRGRRIDAASVILAETPEGELAGFLWCHVEATSDGLRIGWICQLAVVEAYRGLGIARTLLNTLLNETETREIDRLYIELGGDSGELSRILEAIGFVAHSATYGLDIPGWSFRNLPV